jgi:hypothetical protein
MTCSLLLFPGAPGCVAALARPLESPSTPAATGMAITASDLGVPRID